MGPGWAPPPGPGGPGGFGGAAPPARRGPRTGTMVVLALVIALLASTLGSFGDATSSPARRVRAHDPSFDLGKAPSGANVRPPSRSRAWPRGSCPAWSRWTVEPAATEGGHRLRLPDQGRLRGDQQPRGRRGRQGGEPDPDHVQQPQDHHRPHRRPSTPSSDLAVVKPEETFGTPEITLGNSDQVVVGDPVIAIGSPLGLTGTVTTGIVSSLNRPVIAGDESGTSTAGHHYISADPDRRGDQPRQLGRPAGRHATARSSASTRRSPP